MRMETRLSRRTVSVVLLFAIVLSAVWLNIVTVYGDFSIGNNMLSDINIGLGYLPDTMSIESFSVGFNGEAYEAVYSVRESPEMVHVEIFADTDEEGFDGQEVYAGDVGVSGTLQLNMEALLPGEYHFYLQVTATGASSKVYAKEVLSYRQKEDTGKVSGVRGGRYNDGYYLSWDASKESDRFTVLIWDAHKNLCDQIEVAGDSSYYGTFQKEETVFLSVVPADRRGNYDLIEVRPESSFPGEVIFDLEEEITAQPWINGRVKMKGDGSYDVFVNGEKKLENQTQTGDCQVELEDGENEVVFLLTDGRDNKKEFVKKVYVDTVPPALSVSESLDHLITTRSYVYVSGYSESGALLMLNGRTVEMHQGYFNEKVELMFGENEILLTASDLAGNMSVYRAEVRYEINRKGRKELYIVTLTVTALIFVYLIVFVKGYPRRKIEENTGGPET